MPIPPIAWATARRPSERLSVTEWPISAVSADKRLMSSPVRVLSKKPTSCLKIEEKRDSRKFLTICCPEKITRDKTCLIHCMQKMADKNMCMAVTILKFEQIINHQLSIHFHISYSHYCRSLMLVKVHRKVKRAILLTASNYISYLKVYSLTVTNGTQCNDQCKKWFFTEIFISKPAQTNFKPSTHFNFRLTTLVDSQYCNIIVKCDHL